MSTTEESRPVAAQRLAEHLARTGETVPALAHRTGLKERTLRSYLKGERHPGEDARRALEDVLGLAAGELDPGRPQHSTWQLFCRHSPLAQDPQTAAVRRFLGSHLSDSELIALGGNVGQWRAIESLVSVLHDQMAVWRNRNGLDRAHHVEEQSEAFRASLVRR